VTDPVVQAMARDLRTHVAISDELAVYVVEMLILAARQVRPDVMPGVVTPHADLVEFKGGDV